MSEDQYDRLNAIERVKLAMAQHAARQPFKLEPDDVRVLMEEYDRQRSNLMPVYGSREVEGK